jgi:mannose/fructose/N-acetylgalactosamine-specific phosphotransferase system component IIC
VIPEVLGTLLVGGIAALDATAVGQTLLSQPLVTATLLGALWHDMPVALSVGVVLQILAASTLPVGARTPEDYAAGGVVGTGLALMLASQQSFSIARDGCALVGVFAGMIAAALGVPLIKWQRRRNEGLSHWCEAELQAGNEGALARAQAAGVGLAFGVGVSYSAVCLGLGAAVMLGVVQSESLWLSRAWTLAQPLWIGLGLAQLLSAFVQRRLLRVAVFAAALFVTWLLLMTGAS